MSSPEEESQRSLLSRFADRFFNIDDHPFLAMLSAIVGIFLVIRLLSINTGTYAEPPHQSVTPTTTTSPAVPTSIPTQPVSRSEWSPSQYGCHSDGRCLDFLDEWCDEQNTAPFGNDDFVCEPVRDPDVVWDDMSGSYEWIWDTYDDERGGYDDPGYDVP